MFDREIHWIIGWPERTTSYLWYNDWQGVLWKTLMSTYVVDIWTNNQAWIRLTSSLLLRPFHKQTTVICSCHQPKYFDFVIYSWNKWCKNLCFCAYQEETVCVEKGPSKYCVFGLLMGSTGLMSRLLTWQKSPQSQN